MTPTFLEQLLADTETGYVAPDQLDHPVTDSPELRRISTLTRRMVFDTSWAPVSLGGSLHPEQLAALSEARASRGLLAPIGCGVGKTLITMLLHSAVDAGGRSVILIPASMEPQFFSEYEKFKKLFVLPIINSYKDLTNETQVVVLKYSILSSPRFFSSLQDISPSLIIADECHYLKIRESVRTKRFMRYYKQHPDTLFCGLSGTITSNSLQDFAHLAKLALRQGAPVPLTWPVLTEWSEALDARLQRRRPPGALMSFCSGLETPLQGYQRRLTETPGVVASNKNNVQASLYIRRRKFSPSAKVKAALEDLRATWTLPSGEEISDALEFSRKAREIACGFYYVWDWPNGEIDWEWLEARTNWSREVRQKLHRSAGVGFDSEHLLELAAIRGQWRSVSYGDWERVKGRKSPPVRAVWLDDTLVKDAVAFGNESPCIIWTRHDAVGDAIGKEGGWHLYNGGAVNDRALLQVTGKETIVCSVSACGTGKNLQMFNRQLITSPMSGGLSWEQLLARTHREGQREDQVDVEVYLHTQENTKAFRKAQEEAKFQQELEGAQKRMLMATVCI